MSMIEYYENKDLAVIDGYRFRRDKKTGYYLSSKPIGKSRKRLHLYVWEKQNGNVPKGCHVHHVDGDKGNNELDNLMLISRYSHLSFHGTLNYISNKEETVNNLRSGCLNAKKWHASKEGHEWHKKHYKKMKNQLFQEQDFICEMCGKAYTGIDNGNNRFCSNACKTKWRKESGKDDVMRSCAYCGKEFKVNKYAKRKYCSIECGFKASPRGGDTHKNKEH